MGLIYTCMSMPAKDLHRLNVSLYPYSSMPTIQLIWISRTHLKLSIPKIKIYHQISITFIIHAPLHKPAALPILTISVNDITIQPATQPRNYKVRFDFTFSMPFLTNYTFNQSKHFYSCTQEKKKCLSFY